MSQNWINLAYLVAAVCLIVGIRELSHPRTARRGNLVAAFGMAIAILFTLFDRDIDEYWLMALGVAIGTVVGIASARMVRMTAMPQMVALFNGVGGGAAALIAAALVALIALTAATEDGVWLALLFPGALILGVLFVLPIGGADMPVVISLLNACTGLAAASTGFVLDNTALIIGGTPVGASGTLLTILM